MNETTPTTQQASSERILEALELLNETAAAQVLLYAFYLAQREENLESTPEERRNELLEQRQEQERRKSYADYQRHVAAFVSTLDGKRRRNWENMKASREFQSTAADRYQITLDDLVLLKEAFGLSYQGLYDTACNAFDLGFYRGLCYATNHSPHAAVNKIRKTAQSAARVCVCRAELRGLNKWVLLIVTL